MAKNERGPRRSPSGARRPDPSRTALPDRTRPGSVAVARDDGPLVKLLAEAFGTFVLVLGGCGSAIFAAGFGQGATANLGIGFLGVSLAFGLSVLVMAAAVGGISGGHFNPAVTIGLAAAGRTTWRDVPGYIAAQAIGAIVAATTLFLVASGRPGFDAVSSGFATNGYGSRSPGGYSLPAVILTEVVLTAVFLAVIIAATGQDAPRGLAPVAIGLTLTLIHLVSIPVDNTSVNPARSFGVALFAGPAALGQLWVFLLAPAAGGALAGLVFRVATGLRTGLGGAGDPRLR